MNLAELKSAGIVYIVEDNEAQYRHRLYIGCSIDPKSSLQNLNKNSEHENISLIHEINSVDPFGTKQRLRDEYQEFRLKSDDWRKESPRGWFDLDQENYFRLLRITKDNPLLTLKHRLELRRTDFNLFGYSPDYYTLLYMFFRTLFDVSVGALSSELKSMDIDHYSRDISFLNPDLSYSRYPTQLDEVLIDWNTSHMLCFWRALRFNIRTDYWKLIPFLSKIDELSRRFSYSMRRYVNERQSFEELESNISEMNSIRAKASAD